MVSTRLSSPQKDFRDVVGRQKTYGDVRHSTQVVDFVGLDFRYDMEEIRRVRQVAIVKEKADASLL